MLGLGQLEHVCPCVSYLICVIIAKRVLPERMVVGVRVEVILCVVDCIYVGQALEM